MNAAVGVNLLSSDHASTVPVGEVVVSTTASPVIALAPDDVLQRVCLVAPFAESLAATVEEDERDAEGDKKGEEAIDDIDGEMGGTKPGSSEMCGIDTGEGSLVAPLTILFTCDACIILGHGICK